MTRILLIGLLSCLFYGANAQQKQAEKLYKKAIGQFNKGKFAVGFDYLAQSLAADSLYREALYAQAFYLLESGQAAQALPFFEKTLRHYPDDAGAPLGKAHALMELAQYEAAEEWLIAQYAKDSSRSELYSAFGRLYALVKLYNDSNAFLDKALLLDPNNAEAFQLFAHTFRVLGDPEIALAYINKSLQLAPKSPEGRRLKAQLLLDNKRYKELIAIYEDLAKKHAHVLEEEDLYTWAMGHYYLRSYNKALFYLESIEKAQKPETLYALALVHFQLKKKEKAIETMLKALKMAESQQSPQALLHYDYAVMLAAQKDFEGAKNSFFEAIKAAPELILQEDDKGRKVALLADLRQVLKEHISQAEQDSIYIVALQEKALQMAAQDQGEAATKLIQKALAKDSLNVRSLTVWAAVQALGDRYEASMATFLQAEQKAQKKDLEFLFHMKALALSDMKAHSEALVYFDKAIGINPSRADFYAEKAYVLGQLARYEQAIRQVSIAILLDSQDSDYLKSRIEYYFEIEAYDKAIRDCERLLELNVLDEQAYYLRAQAYTALEQWDKAIEDIRWLAAHYPQDAVIAEMLQEAEEALKK